MKIKLNARNGNPGVEAELFISHDTISVGDAIAEGYVPSNFEDLYPELDDLDDLRVTYADLRVGSREFCGIAVCSPSDQFERTTGRRIALNKLLANMKEARFPKEDRQIVADAARVKPTPKKATYIDTTTINSVLDKVAQRSQFGKDADGSARRIITDNEANLIRSLINR